MNTLPWQVARETLTKQSNLLETPLNGSFELTPFCNFECKMCYVRLDSQASSLIGRPRTTDEWITLGQQVANSGCLTLLLTGGEPLLRNDFCIIYKALIKMGFLITIYTNAALVTPEVINCFQEFPPSFIRVSLYGASNDTYFKVCGDKNGFDKVANGVRMLKEINMPVALTSTLIQENEADSEAMAAFADMLNIPFSQTVSVVLPIRGAKSEACTSRLSENRIVQTFSKESPKSYCNFSPVPDPMTRCRNGNSKFWITWDGRMTLCAMSTEPFSYPFSNNTIDFNNAWIDFKDKLKQLKAPEKCMECSYIKHCQSCVGVFCAETGSASQTSERICNLAKARYTLHYNSLQNINEGE